jgi:S-adenosylhomocysteine hydrolase/mannose-6-phosphate isomerase-like protein (cupin superfamily)
MSELLRSLTAGVKGPGNKPHKLVVCTHATFSTAELCKSLVELQLEVVFCPVSYSTDSDSLAAIRGLGVKVMEDAQKLLPFLAEADCVIEDGARLSKLIDEYDVKLKRGFYSIEQTSGGVRYFEEHAPSYPVINVAQSATKLTIENKRATPAGVLHYFTEATDMLLSGKQVLVIGYGSIGEGIAELARVHGAQVSVYDYFATKRLFAKRQGFNVIEQDELGYAFTTIDVVFTATNTYQGDLIGVEKVLLMRDGMVICNAGSGRGEFAVELQTPGTFQAHDAELHVEEVGDNILVTCTKHGESKQITVLASSFPINLHLGKGTSHDAIEVVMALLFLAALKGPKHRRAGLQSLDMDLQETVAESLLGLSRRLKLAEPIFVKGGSGEVITKPYGGIAPFHNELNHMASLSVARVWFEPGTKTRGHYHRHTQESYYAEEGSADIILWPQGSPAQKTTYKVAKGDYLLVPEGYFHDVRVTSQKDFVCLVIATPPFVAWDQFFKTQEAS